MMLLLHFQNKVTMATDSQHLLKLYFTEDMSLSRNLFQIHVWRHGDPALSLN